MNRGEKVTHYLVAIEGQRKWLGAFLDWLGKRTYPTTFPNHPRKMEPPVIKEMRFYDISVPTGSRHNLIGDLSPFNLTNSFLGKKFGFLSKVARKVLGLTAPPKGADVSIESSPHRDDLSIYVLGSKEDAWQDGNELL